jgi:hypothetical protein
MEDLTEDKKSQIRKVAEGSKKTALRLTNRM